nr:MAG TPA: hypothetical protein [Bacteriophage sp.]
MTHRVLGPRIDKYKIKCYRSVKKGGGVIPICAYFPLCHVCSGLSGESSHTILA